VYLNLLQQTLQAAEYFAEQTGIAGSGDPQYQGHCCVAYMHASLHKFCMPCLLSHPPIADTAVRLHPSKEQAAQAAACCAEQTGTAHGCHFL